MIDLTIFITLIALSIFFAINGKKASIKTIKNRNAYYVKTVISNIVLLLLFFVLNAKIYAPLDFEKIGKGILIPDYLISVFFVIFLTPFLMSFMPWNTYYPKDASTAKEIFGFPIQLLPCNWTEYFLFNIYIIFGVVFEEMLCRQFMFYSFSQTLNLKGDYLLLVSSLLFAIAHYYQGWKGILSSFVIGLMLGKIFQITETIFFPIILHLIFNLTVSVLTFKRLNDIRKVSKS